MNKNLYITMLISVLTISTLACGATASTATPAPTPTTEIIGRMTHEIGHVCRTSYLNIRTGAGEEYPRKAWLEEGVEVVKITETYSVAGGIWYVVDYADGIGYVNSRYMCE